MLALHRCLTVSKTRLTATSSSCTSLFSRAGFVVSRNYAASPPSLSDGNLADVCNKNVVPSPHPPVMDLSKFTPVPEFVSSEWKSRETKVAIRDGSTGETRTFAQYDQHMNNIASALKSEYALKPDETVALLSPNNVDYLPICLAVGKLGAKVTPINPLSTADELTKVLTRSSSKILFTHAKLLPVALDAAHSSPCVEHIVVLPDCGSDTNIPEGAEHLQRLLDYENLDSKQHPISDVSNHPWLLPYSSGTTGLPKGVMLSHANMVVNLLQLDGIERSVFPPGHKLISPLPCFHIYGMLASLLYCAWR